MMECGTCKQVYGVEQEPAVRSDRLEDLSRHVMGLGGKVCHYCGGPAESLILSMPSRFGGCECVENLRAACFYCRNARGSMSPSEWHKVLRGDAVDLGLPAIYRDRCVQVLWHWDRT